jgi:hypothetical protein
MDWQAVGAAVERLPADRRVHVHSVLYDHLRDPRCLIEVASALPGIEDPAAFNGVFWSLKNTVFAESTNLGDAFVARMNYGFLAPAYRQFIARLRTKVDLPPRLRPTDPPQRIALCAIHLLEPPHSPSTITTGYQKALSDAGKHARIFSTNSGPLAIESPYWRQMGFRAQPELSGLQRVRFHSGETEYDIYSADPKLPWLERVRAAVREMAAFHPDAVISFGGGNIVADLLADTVPVIAFPLSSEWPISLAPTVLDPAGAFAASYFAIKGIDDFEARSVERLPIGFDLPAKSSSKSRAEFGLAEGDFIYVVAGHRLHLTLRGDFLNDLATIFARVPNARLFLIGVDDMQWPEGFQQLAERAVLAPFQRDLRSALALGNAYLNPHQAGGGTTAIWAAAEGLPIVTLRKGDVSMNIGAENARPTRADYVDYAVRLGTNTEFLAHERLRALEIARTTPTSTEAVQRLLGIAARAADRFRVIGSFKAGGS